MSRQIADQRCSALFLCFCLAVLNVQPARFSLRSSSLTAMRQNEQNLSLSSEWMMEIVPCSPQLAPARRTLASPVTPESSRVESSFPRTERRGSSPSLEWHAIARAAHSATLGKHFFAPGRSALHILVPGVPGRGRRRWVIHVQSFSALSLTSRQNLSQSITPCTIISHGRCQRNSIKF